MLCSGELEGHSSLGGVCHNSGGKRSGSAAIALFLRDSLQFPGSLENLGVGVISMQHLRIGCLGEQEVSDRCKLLHQAGDHTPLG